GNELRLAGGAALAAAEELDVVGDDLDRLALRPVLGLPLAPVQPAVDRDGAALGEELRAALALVAPDRDVEVVRLVAPLAGGLVLLARVHRDPQLADRHPARRVPKLGIAGQVADQDDSVDVCHLSPPSRRFGEPTPPPGQPPHAEGPGPRQTRPSGPRRGERPCAA